MKVHIEDSHRNFKDLVEAGFTEKQAERLLGLPLETSNLVTTDELDAVHLSLKTEMDAGFKRVDGEISELRMEMRDRDAANRVWFTTALAVQGMALFGLMLGALPYIVRYVSG